MKNLAVILLGLTMVAGCFLTGSDAAPSFADTAVDAVNDAKPEVHHSGEAMEELAAALANNIVNLAKSVQQDASMSVHSNDCTYAKEKYVHGYHCGSFPTSYFKFSHLSHNCQSIYYSVAFTCPGMWRP
eukprot:scpid96693/ scgid9010/ 